MSINPLDSDRVLITENVYYLNERVIGTCSLCGGPVMVPNFWYSIIPPVPTCKNCGAVRKNDFGSVIPMIKKVESHYNTNTYDKVISNGSW